MKFKMADLVAYMQTSQAHFNGVLAALQLEALKKVCLKDIGPTVVAAILHDKNGKPDAHLLKADMSNPSERLARVHSNTVRACQATADRDELPRAHVEVTRTGGSVDPLLGYHNKEALAAAKQAGVNLKLPFHEQQVTDAEALDNKDPNRVTTTELVNMRSAIKAQRVAAFKENERRKEKWKALTAVEREKHKFSLNRRLVASMLTKAEARRVMLHLPLAKDGKRFDTTTLSGLNALVMYYTKEIGAADRAAFVLEKGLFKRFFSVQVMDQFVTKKLLFKATLGRQPLFDLFSVGHFLRERIMALVPKDEHSEQRKDALIDFSRLLITTERMTNPVELQTAVKAVFGYTPPIDYCRWARSVVFNKDIVVHPGRITRKPASATAGGKRKKGGDDDEDGEGGEEEGAGEEADGEEAAPAEEKVPAKKAKKAPAKPKAVSFDANADEETTTEAVKAPTVPKKRGKKVPNGVANDAEVNGVETDSAPPTAPKKRAPKRKVEPASTEEEAVESVRGEARYNGGLHYLASDEKSPELDKLAAPLKRAVKLRTMDATALAHVVPTLESHTTSSGAAASAAKKSAASAADQDGANDDGAAAAEAEADASDARFADHIAKQLGISKKRVEHFFVYLKDPDLADQIARDWHVPLDESDPNGVVQLELTLPERAAVEKKLAELKNSNTVVVVDEVTGEEKRAKQVGGRTMMRAPLTMQSTRGTKPLGSQLATKSVPMTVKSMCTSSEHLDAIVETEAIDVHHIISYKEALQARRALYAGNATEEQRLAIKFSLAQVPAMVEKVLLDKYKNRLVNSDVNPSNVMLIARKMVKGDAGMEEWLASCDLYCYELRLIERQFDDPVPAGADKLEARAALAFLPLHFSPLAGWSPGDNISDWTNGKTKEAKEAYEKNLCELDLRSEEVFKRAKPTNGVKN